MIRQAVPEELAGERADKVVAVLAGISRAEARRLCDADEVEVDGRTVAARERLEVGAEISFTPPEEEPMLVPEPMEVRVVVDDPHVLVVDKPAGLVVHPGAGHRTPTLAAGLLHRYPELEGVGQEGRWGIVHRLDRDTSGLLLVARTAQAYQRLTADLSARRVHRVYLALVVGELSTPTGTIDAPIGVDPARPTRRRVVAEGKPARSHYRVVDVFEHHGVTLLEVTLETGRTHQIRVHLASIDRPVVGDRVYGRPAAVDAPRVFLHAARLGFTHPVTGTEIEAESPLPEDLAGVVEGLKVS